MARVIQFHEHRLLAELAKRQGLSYTELRDILEADGVSLETAIETARDTLVADATALGARIREDYSRTDALGTRLEQVETRLRELEKDQAYQRKRRTSIRSLSGLATVAAAVLIGLTGIANYSPKMPEVTPEVAAARARYERATKAVEAYDTSMNSPRFGSLDSYTQGQTQYWALVVRSEASNARNALASAELTDHFVRFGWQ